MDYNTMVTVTVCVIAVCATVVSCFAIVFFNKKPSFLDRLFDKGGE